MSSVNYMHYIVVQEAAKAVRIASIDKGVLISDYT